MLTNRLVRRAMGFLMVILAMLAGCHRAPETSPTQSAAMTILADSSNSTAFIGSEAFTNKAIHRVGAMVMDQELGDDFRVVPFGSRTTDHAMDTMSETSGYKMRLPVMRKHVEASLSELFAANRQSGGDGSTNLLFTLQNAHIKCTPRSVIVILSDGVESSETYSVGPSLSAGKPVHLPPPSQPFLKGCRVVFLGIGIAPMSGGAVPETLPDAALQSLIAGWREYLGAAGVSPSDMSFQSIL